MICTASVSKLGAALAGGQGPRLGHRRVRDAARLDGRAQGARLQARPPRRALDRDPAADRPGPARGRRPHRASPTARSTSTATCCRPTAARAARRSPAATSRCGSRPRACWTRASSSAIPLTGSVAAISCGIVGGEALCDLDYSEDSTAEVDANIVMTGDGGLVEVQATAERTPVSRASLDELLELAEPAIGALREAQDGPAADRCRADGGAGATAGRRDPQRAQAPRARARSSTRSSSSRCRRRSSCRRRPATTFAENALIKARAAHRGDGRARRSPTTPGSRRAALGGRPGVLSARFAGADATDEQNLDLLISRARQAGRPLGRLRLRARLRRRRRHRAPLRGPLRGDADHASRAAAAASATTRRSSRSTPAPTTSARWPSSSRTRSTRSATAGARRGRSPSSCARAGRRPR